MNIPMPLLVAVPFFIAAILIGTSPFLSRRLADIIAISTMLSMALICVLIFPDFDAAPLVYWFGGWRPQNGTALGIAFVSDPWSLALIALSAILSAMSFLFAWGSFESAGVIFHVLIIIFVGAMAGFCLSGDIFTLFVFFELMSVAAYGLTAYRIQKSPLAGAINFVITNSTGGFFVLIGLSLLYGRTGALNLAQLGNSLAHTPTNAPFMIVSFTLITTGFFTKAAIAPFHFWLADAHAVAPTPVSVLFSGIMVELGLYAFSRVYWTVYASSFGSSAHFIRDVLLIIGAITALWGGIMCFIQQHIKRLLAFSSISHMGILLMGIALLHSHGLAGVAIYMLAHGLTKGSLFICTGILLHNYSCIEESSLLGRGKPHPIVGILFAAGGLTLAGFPPFGVFRGKTLIEETAEALNFTWVNVIIIIASALTGGTVLRAAGRIFCGWGRRRGLESTGPVFHEDPETEEKSGRTPWNMFLPAAFLLCLSWSIGLLPGLSHFADIAAAQFQNRSIYSKAILNFFSPGMLLPEYRIIEAKNIGSSLGVAIRIISSPALAIVIALFSLSGFRLETKSPYASGMIRGLVNRMRALHSGHVGDYVLWQILGVAGLGLSLAYFF